MPAYALLGQAVDSRSRILSFMKIVLSSSQTMRCLCSLPLKQGSCQSSILLMISAALCCICMAPKCFFYCLMGKLLTTMAWLMLNDLGRCDIRNYSKALEKVKVVEMMPRPFWCQQNSLFWTGIYILSVPRSYDCQSIWNGASEAHKVMYQKKKKMWWNLGTLKLFFFPLLILI